MAGQEKDAPGRCEALPQDRDGKVQARSRDEAPHPHEEEREPAAGAEEGRRSCRRPTRRTSARCSRTPEPKPLKEIRPCLASSVDPRGRIAAFACSSSRRATTEPSTTASASPSCRSSARSPTRPGTASRRSANSADCGSSASTPPPATHDLSYSKLMAGLKKAGSDVNRKVLAEIAVEDPKGFASLVASAKSALGLPAAAASAPRTPKPRRRVADLLASVEEKRRVFFEELKTARGEGRDERPPPGGRARAARRWLGQKQGIVTDLLEAAPDGPEGTEGRGRRRRQLAQEGRRGRALFTRRIFGSLRTATEAESPRRRRDASPARAARRAAAPADGRAGGGSKRRSSRSATRWRTGPRSSPTGSTSSRSTSRPTIRRATRSTRSS